MDAPQVQYVRTSDGYDIAYAVCGQGVPLVFMSPIASHIQRFWAPQSFLRPWVEGLAERFLLVQYDGPGQGMSGRGVPADYSLSALDNALEAVLGRLRLERFVLLGSNAMGHAAVRYCVAQPQRVRALVMCCCSLSGRMWPVVNAIGVASQNWNLFPSMYMAAMRAPTPEHRQYEIDTFRQSVTQRDWLTMTPVWSASSIEQDVGDLLTPTLILHPINYENMAAEVSMNAAAQIAHSQMVLINGKTEYGDAADGIRAIGSFLQTLPPEPVSSPPAVEAPLLSQREVEVLRLVAAGRTNQQIADTLVISRNTVRRHVSNVFDKTGVANRAQTGVYARDNGLV